MEGQLLLVGLLVALAAGYLGVAGWRGWQRSRQGCSSCCAGQPSPAANPQVFIPSKDLRLRAPAPRPLLLEQPASPETKNHSEKL